MLNNKNNQNIDSKTKAQIKQGIIEGLKLISQGEPFEIRIIGDKTKKGDFTVNGIFDNYKDAVLSIEPYLGHKDVYMNLNDFEIAEGTEYYYNGTEGGEGVSVFKVRNDNVVKYRFFYVDIDPIRKVPKGTDITISATDKESQAAAIMAEDVEKFLSEEFMFPSPVKIFSGNGYHLLYYVDFEVNDENVGTVKKALKALAEQFSGEAEVDTSVYNPGRLIKVPGTIACKGSNTQERPHRYSKILSVPNEPIVLDITKIKNLAASFKGNPTTSSNGSSKGSEKEESPSSWAWKFLKSKQCEFFTNENDSEAYITIQNASHGSNTYKIDGSDFLSYLLLQYAKNHEDGIVSARAFDTCIDNIRAVATSGRVTKPVQFRIANVGDAVFYDLCTPNGDVVKISKHGVETTNFDKLDLSKLKMMETNVMLPQSLPVANAANLNLAELLDSFLNLTENDKILLVVTLVCWFLPSIPRVILVLLGGQGSGKTLLSQNIQKLVDPLKHDVSTLSKKSSDIVVSLSTQYLTVFDNITTFTADVSNLFCQASTGGSLPKRKLYTDNELVSVKFQNCIILNGINDFLSFPDLRDRIVELNLQPLEGARKTANDIEAAFEELRPAIMAEIFDTLSQAMKIVDSITVENPSRMADFERWGCAVSKVLYGKESTFLDAYRVNRMDVIDDSINDNPLAQTVYRFLHLFPHTKFPLKLPVSIFFKDITAYARTLGNETTIKLWPKTTAAFSKALNKFEPCFKSKGITFERVHGHRHREITFSLSKQAKAEWVCTGIKGKTFRTNSEKFLEDITGKCDLLKSQKFAVLNDEGSEATVYIEVQ